MKMYMFANENVICLIFVCNAINSNRFKQTSQKQKMYIYAKDNIICLLLSVTL